MHTPAVAARGAAQNEPPTATLLIRLCVLFVVHHVLIVKWRMENRYSVSPSSVKTRMKRLKRHCHHTRTRGRRTNKQVFCLSHRAIASSTAPPRHTERLVKAASSPSQPQPQLDHSQRDRSQRCALNTVGTPWSRERSPARGGARACAGRALHKMRTISHKRGIRVLAGPCFARYREDGLGVACHWPQRPAWPRQSAKGDACAGAGTIHRR